MNHMKNNQGRKPKFAAGEAVKVRPKQEISKSVDSLGKLDGCLMMGQMWEFCGQRFKILKVVDNFFDEYQYRMYKVRSPLYILDGLICNGVVKSFEHKCDRSCYILWHEDWLEKS
jgi:hypothetical protein